MAPCRVGHVYIVETALTQPPKAKFAICVCINPDWFIWINTDPRSHGRDQVPIPAGVHQLVRHDSHIDLSRIVAHPAWELEGANEFPCISQDLARRIVDAIDSGLEVLSPRHAKVVREGLTSLYT